MAEIKPNDTWPLLPDKDEESPLLCSREEYPYPEETLPKLFDRESTIRAEWQLNLREQHERLADPGQSSQHKPCHYIATEALPDIIEGVCAFLNRIEAGIARRDKQYIEELASMPWIGFCAIAFTNILDGAVRHKRLSDVIVQIADNCQTEVKWRNYEKREETFYNDLIKQLHQQNSSFYHMKAAVDAAMQRRAEGTHGNGEKKELILDNWSASFSRWLGALYVDIIINTTGFFEWKPIPETGKKRKTTCITVTEKLEKLINDAESRIGLYGGYYLPLPVPPRDWTSTQCGGFWTKYAGQKELIKNHNKEYQEKMLERSDELSEHVFPAINAAQHTAWRINHKIYEIVCACVDNKYKIKGLPDAEEDPEFPVCPKCRQIVTEEEIVNKNHKCFIERDKDCKNPHLSLWKRRRRNVYRERQSLKSKRLQLRLGLEAANLLIDDERFYYVYQTDFRGRLYPLGTLNPQGTDWQKAILEFADGVALGEHGAKWLAVHLANTYGNDKVSFAERVKWVEEHEELILASAERPLENFDLASDKRPLWTEADEPFCFLAACLEWAEYKKYGTEYKSHIPIALDASCSGIQHYSAMLQDEEGARTTNVKCIDPTKGKNDIYKQVADKTLELIEQDKASAEDGEKAVYVLSHKIINRETVKKAVMTFTYGATYRTCSDSVGEKVIKKMKEEMKKFKGTDEKMLEDYSNYVSKKVWKAIPEVVEVAKQGMRYLKSLARLFKDKALPITWKAPTGFYVQQSYYDYRDNKDSEKRIHVKRIHLNIGGSFKLNKGIRYWSNDAQNKRIKLEFIDNNDSSVIDINRQVSGIAPNFIHSLDAAHLMFSVQNAKLAGIDNFALIHDSFGVHAGHTEEFKKIINNCFYELYAKHTPLEDLTEHLLRQAEPKPEEAQEIRKKLKKLKKGTLDLEDIKTAEYLFA